MYPAQTCVKHIRWWKLMTLSSSLTPVGSSTYHYLRSPPFAAQSAWKWTSPPVFALCSQQQNKAAKDISRSEHKIRASTVSGLWIFLNMLIRLNDFPLRFHQSRCVGISPHCLTACEREPGTLSVFSKSPAAFPHSTQSISHTLKFRKTRCI